MKTMRLIVAKENIINSSKEKDVFELKTLFNKINSDDSFLGRISPAQSQRYIGLIQEYPEIHEKLVEAEGFVYPDDGSPKMNIDAFKEVVAQSGPTPGKKVGGNNVVHLNFGQ